MAAQLILGLSILVTLHELGHFIAARAFGIKVEKFYLFFDAWGVKLFSFKRGDTEYGIGWLPLGGYVKIAGMIDESMDKEALKLPPQPWEFRSKPAWQRLIVMIGGVTMNALLGIAIFAFTLLYYTKAYLPPGGVSGGIYAYELGQKAGFRNGDQLVAVNGKPLERFSDIASTRVLMGSTVTVNRDGKLIDITIPSDFYRHFNQQKTVLFIGPENFAFVIDTVLPGNPAAKAGVKKGDRILAIDGVKLTYYGELRERFAKMAGKTVSLIIDRNASPVVLNVQVGPQGTIGIGPNDVHRYQKYTFGSALAFGSSDAIEALTSTAKGLGKIITGKEKASESLQGPIGIARIYGPVWNWERFWRITGLLSMVLALMNILPIPALDGGHVIFLLIETISRRKLSDKFMERAQVVGMVLLLTLMVFVIGNDIWKLF